MLRAFKALHRARQHIFEGDYKALQAGRLKINEEFRKNKNVTNQDAISEVWASIMFTPHVDYMYIIITAGKTGKRSRERT